MKKKGIIIGCIIGVLIVINYFANRLNLLTNYGLLLPKPKKVEIIFNFHGPAGNDF